MKIVIRNCNNIESAEIDLAPNKLNIKFAPNGTGKTTIAKAIIAQIGTTQTSLRELLPFKLRQVNPQDRAPQVIGVDHLQNPMCFNEDYVNQFVFKPNELLSNSFDIFVRNAAYDKYELEIETIVASVRQQFINNSELEILISTLKELAAAFSLTKTDALAKSSIGMKAFASGNRIEHVHEELEPFRSLIQSPSPVEWIDWHLKGTTFLTTDACPFCSSDVSKQKAIIQRVGEEYDKNTIKNILAILNVFNKLEEYFSITARNNLRALSKLSSGLEPAHKSFLIEVMKQTDDLIKKLENIRAISALHFQGRDQVSQILPTYKIELEYFSHLNSDKTKTAVDAINSSIDTVLAQANDLQRSIGIQRQGTNELVRKYQFEINNFLSHAGYQYNVALVGDVGQSQLRLLHNDHQEHLIGGAQHLSFGERNAFAIVLFMYECLAKKPDLIILDDPISSFDKNKKYAILEMLFLRGNDSCLKGKNVLMFTHDVEPIIDTIKVLRQFRDHTTASFLKMATGTINELAITRDDIETFPVICKKVLTSDKHEVIKLIYLRRELEIVGDLEAAYQVLSNLFKKRDELTDTRLQKNDNDTSQQMEDREVQEGCKFIASRIAGFEYKNSLNNLRDLEMLKSLYISCKNGYEKLQIFRFIDPVDHKVIRKFVNETYHIENEFVSQLDPAKFDTIPEYVINECDTALGIKSAINAREAIE